MAWLEKIVPSIGLLIGIVFVAIGSVMMLSSLLKIVTYSSNTVTPVYYECPPIEAKIAEPTPETSETSAIIPSNLQEIEDCQERFAKDERARYLANKKDNVVDGAVFLFVGIIFWIIFGRKVAFRKSKK